MTKKVAMIVQSTLLVMFVQGCWADNLSSTEKSSGNPGSGEWSAYGKYTESLKVGCLSADNQPDECEVENTLVIKRGDGDLVKFSIGIVGANFHECQIEGFAVKKNGNLEFRENYKDSSGKVRECVLTIKHDSGMIVLNEAEDRNCKRRYCGQRASFTGKKFPVQ